MKGMGLKFVGFLPKRIMNNKIKFSHNYPKVWGQTKAKLIYVQLLKAKDVQANTDLLEYDTKFCDPCDYEEHHTDFIGDLEHRHYPLPKYGMLIQLVFLGDKNIPFCTIRSEYSPLGNKLEYYASRLDEEFEIVVKGD